MAAHSALLPSATATPRTSSCSSVAAWAIPKSPSPAIISGGANGHFEGLDAVGQPAELGDTNAGTGQYTTPAVLESHSTERGCYGPQGKTDGSSNDALKRCLANQLKENGGIGSISEQLLDTRANVTIGGGSKYFRQTVQGGECAGKTVWEQAKEMGYQTVENDPAAIAMIVKTAKISR